MATVQYGGEWQRSGSAIGGRGPWWKTAVVAAAGVVGGWWVLSPTKPISDKGAVAGGVVHRAAAAGEESLRGAAAAEQCRKLLAEAERKLESVPTMTAVFHRQERVEGELQPLHVVE